MEETLDHIHSIIPIDFFHVSVDLFQNEKRKLGKKNLLPEFSMLLGEESFAKVFMGWDPHGISFEITVQKKIEETFFPEFRKGDSIELFLDTRDNKSSGITTVFCHHLVFLPKDADGVIAEEVTRFRKEDGREHFDLSSCKINVEEEKRRYTLHIYLPSECLYGYDPGAFNKLGFAYRINASDGEVQHFTLSSKMFSLEKHPSLWSSLKMRKK